MRQLKNYLDAKKPMWNCKPCTCLTLQCRRESEVSCSCDGGEEGGNRKRISFDIDYGGSTYNVGQRAELGFTTNLESSEIQVTLSNDYFGNTQLEDNGGGHRTLYLTAINTGQEGLDFTVVTIGNEEVNTSTNIYAIQRVASITPIDTDVTMYTSTEEGYARFNYTPSNAYLTFYSITAESNNDIAVPYDVRGGNGLAELIINTNGEEGTSVITYRANDDPNNRYNVNVSVVAEPEPSNSIIVGPANTRRGGLFNRGDRHNVKFFAEDVNSVNYIQATLQDGQFSDWQYVGIFDNQKYFDMQPTLEMLGSGLETAGEGHYQFTDDAWTLIEGYCNESISSLDLQTDISNLILTEGSVVEEYEEPVVPTVTCVSGTTFSANYTLEFTLTNIPDNDISRIGWSFMQEGYVLDVNQVHIVDNQDGSFTFTTTAYTSGQDVVIFYDSELEDIRNHEEEARGRFVINVYPVPIITCTSGTVIYDNDTLEFVLTDVPDGDRNRIGYSITSDCEVIDCNSANLSNVGADGSFTFTIQPYNVGEDSIIFYDTSNPGDIWNTFDITVSPAATTTITGLETNEIIIGDAGMDVFTFYYTPADAQNFDNIYTEAISEDGEAGPQYCRCGEITNDGNGTAYIEIHTNGEGNGTDNMIISDGENVYPFSVTVEQTLPSWHCCETCIGYGTIGQVADESLEVCPDCDGYGYIKGEGAPEQYIDADNSPCSIQETGASLGSLYDYMEGGGCSSEGEGGFALPNPIIDWDDELRGPYPVDGEGNTISHIIPLYGARYIDINPTVYHDGNPEEGEANGEAAVSICAHIYGNVDYSSEQACSGEECDEGGCYTYYTPCELASGTIDGFEDICVVGANGFSAPEGQSGIGCDCSIEIITQYDEDEGNHRCFYITSKGGFINMDPPMPPDPDMCPECGGSGVIWNEEMGTEVECPSCGGTGIIGGGGGDDVCPICGGGGCEDCGWTGHTSGI